MTNPAMTTPDISIVIVSFNPRNILRECLQCVYGSEFSGTIEVLVVDNASRDGSEEMVRNDFPQVQMLQANGNRGFGPANNLALRMARGRYVMLLNSDAFLCTNTLQLAMEHMDTDPACGAGGARRVGRQGEWQPSGRAFPTPVLEAFTMLGLAYHFPKSRTFGKLDRTYADQNAPAEVDWVVGAFAIIRAEALQTAGIFDERFFLYYEEVDLFLRIKQSGYRIMYWPDLVVTHLGGESSKQVKTLEMSGTGAQLLLWRMRSTFLYYRKRGGARAWLTRRIEQMYYQVVILRNLWSKGQQRMAKKQRARTSLRLLNQAWKETDGGRVSPAQPW